MKFWILTGSPESWYLASTDNTWGVKKRLKSLWKKVSKGDILIFYATDPVSGVIGIGKVKSKSKDETPSTPEELIEKKIIYPYKIKFSIIHMLPRDSWENERVPVKDLKIFYTGEINYLTDKEIIKKLLDRIDASLQTQLIKLTRKRFHKVREKIKRVREKPKIQLIESVVGFLRPNWYKMIIFLVLTTLFIPVFYKLYFNVFVIVVHNVSGGTATHLPMDYSQAMDEMNYITPLYNLLSPFVPFSPSEYRFKRIDYFVLLPIYWYLLSCLIVFIFSRPVVFYRKRKKVKLIEFR